MNGFLRKFLALVLLTLPVRAAEKPNFVFLLVDDLGWGDFGCYGAEFYETPNIDRLAKDGMLFTEAYAASTVCSPSRAAILSGRYPARLHLTDWIDGHNRPKAKLSVPDWTMKLAHERTLLPEALKEGGYDTIFLGKWHLMPIGQPDFEDHFPTSHGFDTNIGGREWGQPKGPGKYFSPFGMSGLDDGEERDFLTDNLTDEAIGFLEKRDGKKPFLLYFSYYTVHSPLMAPPDLVEKYEEKAKTWDNKKSELLHPARAGMIEKLDDSVGRIRAKLEELGLAENTVVILTGDNGGDFQETSGGLRDFKGLSHEGATRVPLIVKWPGKTAAGSTAKEMTIGTDFYPTMLEMAGLPARPAEHLDGVSIVPLLTGESETLPRESIFWHYPHYHRTMPYSAVRHGDLKLIEYLEDGKTELYNLAEDPTEKNDLSTAEPEKKAELVGELEAWKREVGAQKMAPNPNYKPK